MRLVVSQPMFLPWLGVFEQLRLADCYVHYDDVQLPRGRSFCSRVQISGAEGRIWLTAPIDRKRSGKLISETSLVSSGSWREAHLETLRHCYRRQSNFREMFELAREIYSFSGDGLAEFNISATELIAERIGISAKYILSSSIGAEGSSTDRLVEISTRLGASVYLTGHGALGYLEHGKFVERDVEVHYMSYVTRPWAQRSATFTPYVSIFDLLAAVPFENVRSFLISQTMSWRDIDESNRGVRIVPN